MVRPIYPSLCDSSGNSICTYCTVTGDTHGVMFSTKFWSHKINFRALDFIKAGIMRLS